MALGFVRAVPSAAASCPETHKNVASREGDHVHRGVGDFSVGQVTQDSPPGMKVENSAVTCARVSSLFVFRNLDYQIEVGWFDTTEGGCGYPSNKTTPFSLAFAVKSGVNYCDVSPIELTWGNYHTFRVQDSNLDGVFSFAHNQTSLWSFDAGWSYGWAMTNGERHSYSDTAHSEFYGLMKDTASGWSDWSSPRYACDNDGAYDVVIHSNVNVTVEQTGTGTKFDCPYSY
jgi:hypothetical protein